MSIVIDTSALMAFIKREPGADRVGPRLSQGVVSSVIFAETLSKLALQGYDGQAARLDFLTAGLSVEPFGPDDVQGVVVLSAFASRDISLADRICLALALDRGLPVLTADRTWAGLGLPLQVELIR